MNNKSLGVAGRRTALRKILQANPVHSQMELIRLLAEMGYPATQATVSRDLMALRARKVHTPRGGGRYTLPDDEHALQIARVSRIDDAAHVLRRTGRQLLLDVAQASNLLVAHTPAGAANYFAAMLDESSLEGVLGTLAGDDTVMIITATPEIASKLKQHLEVRHNLE